MPLLGYYNEKDASEEGEKKTELKIKMHLNVFSFNHSILNYTLQNRKKIINFLN